MLTETAEHGSEQSRNVAKAIVLFRFMDVWI